MQKYRFNQQIAAPEVRVISEQGEQVGIFKLGDALSLAGEHGLDLVEISPHAQPPVVKLIAYDKFRYQQKKMEQRSKKQAKKIEVKTIRLSAKIAKGDLATKAHAADKFLTDGDLVKVELRMKGREQAFGNLAENQIKAFLELITLPYRVEVPTKRLGGTLTLTIAPSKQ